MRRAWWLLPFYTLSALPGLGLSLGVFDVTDNTSRQQWSLGASFSF